MSPFGLTSQEKEGYDAAQAAAKACALELGYEACTFVEIRAWWGDQDPFGHANNAVYFKWLEAGRFHWMKELGVMFPSLSRSTVESSFTLTGKGKGLILANVSNAYFAPVLYPDTVLVAHKIIDHTERKMVLESLIYSFAQRKVVSKGEAGMVSYDFDQLKATSLPDELQAALRQRFHKSVAKL